MSKTFDEGGAKGLLLANLGVGNDGCNIVFDSKDEEPKRTAALTATTTTDSADGDRVDDESSFDAEGPSIITSTTLDIASLIANFRACLGNESLEQVKLVPQLQDIREDFRELDKRGFVDLDAKTPKVRLCSGRIGTRHENLDMCCCRKGVWHCVEHDSHDACATHTNIIFSISSRFSKLPTGLSS